MGDVNDQDRLVWTGSVASCILLDAMQKTGGDIQCLVPKCVYALNSFKQYIESRDVEVGTLRSSAIRKNPGCVAAAELFYQDFQTPVDDWSENEKWAYIKREFLELPSVFNAKGVRKEKLSVPDLLGKIRNAELVLEKAAKEDALLLWTGGKEAQVLADILDRCNGDLDFGTIDTGNHFSEMYDFRRRYAEENGIEVIVERHDEFIERIIENTHDPRGYHGRHTGTWTCDTCGEEAELENRTVKCGKCGSSRELEGVERQNIESSDYGVAESCGNLKVVPIRRFIEKHGYNTLVTGVRGSDALAQAEAKTPELMETRDNPSEHKRFNPLLSWSVTDVWAYIHASSVALPSLYEDGYIHTDSKCCTDPQETGVSEYGEGGRDVEKAAVKDKLQEMGYV